MIQEAPIAYQVFVYLLALVGVYFLVSFAYWRVKRWWMVRKMRKTLHGILAGAFIDAVDKGLNGIPGEGVPTPQQIENWLHGSWDDHDKEKIREFAENEDREMMGLGGAPEVLVHLARVCPDCGSAAPLVERFTDDTGENTEGNYECIKCPWKCPIDDDMGFDQTTTVEVKN